MPATTTQLRIRALAGLGGGGELSAGGLTVAVLTGQAMASLDTSIVNVAAPELQRDLHLSGATLQLAIYTYLLTYAGGLITAARLGARRGFGAVFSAGVALFTASSLACGAAIDPTMLVAARATQGLGAALMVAQVLSLLQTGLEGERRRRALALYGLVLAVGVAAGQVLGGVLVTLDLLGGGWRPIFLVNVPIGMVLLAFAAGRLPAGSYRAQTGSTSPARWGSLRRCSLYWFRSASARTPAGRPGAGPFSHRGPV